MKRSSMTKALLVAALLLLVAAVVTTMGSQVDPRKLDAPLDSLPLVLGQWRGVGPDQHLDQGTLQVLKPTSYLLRNYMNPRGNVCAVFIAYFALQQEGQIIHSPRHCLPGNGWQISERTEVAVESKGRRHLVNHLILSRNLQKMSVLYWYQGRGRIEANEYLSRARLVLDGMLHDRNEGALVRLTSSVTSDIPKTLELQLGLAAQIIPAMNKILPQL